MGFENIDVREKRSIEHANGNPFRAEDEETNIEFCILMLKQA